MGAGTYANHLCAISGTGRGEEFIKHTVARDVAAIMEYKELPIGKAVHKVVHEQLDKNMGGVVAVSNTGEVAMAFNTPSMFRASAHEGGERYAAIWWFTVFFQFFFPNPPVYNRRHGGGIDRSPPFCKGKGPH